MSSSLAKLASAFAVVMGSSEASFPGTHPLLQAPANVNSIVHDNGGVSMRMYKSKHQQEKSRGEYLAMKKQRAIHTRMEARKNASWTHSVQKWFGLVASNIAETEMPMLNFIDETFTVKITTGDAANTAPNYMQAVVDTALAYTVLETTVCTDCSSDLAEGGLKLDKSVAGYDASATVVSGTLNNPDTTYSGFKGTATFCIANDGNVSADPINGNIASLPCLIGAKVHFADTVATPNKYAAAYLGMALGNGQDFDGDTPDSTYLIMNQFEDKNRMDDYKGFAIGLATDDGNGRDDSLTTSYMDFGTTTATGVSGDKGTIQFDTTGFYWKTTLDGIRFGGTVSGAYGLTDATISVDTGVQCLYVPEDTYEFVHDTLLNYSTGYYMTADGETVVDCGDTQNMQNIQLLVNGYWIEIAQNDYLNIIPTEYNSDDSRSTGACRVCLKPSWDKGWHIGTSALIGYYTEFNFDNQKVSFTPLSAGTKLPVVAGEKPDRILGISVFTVVMLSGAIVLCIFTFVALTMAVFCDINIFGWLIPDGSSRAQAKKTKKTLEDSSEVTLDQLEKLIETALLKKRNVVSVNALV